MRRIWGLTFIGLMLASGSAVAGGSEQSGLEGKWRFLTTGEYEGYVHGTLKVGNVAGSQTCKLIVYQSEFGSAIEACRVEQEGHKVTIIVEEVVSSSVPKWRQEHFRLVRDGDVMTGQVTIVVDFPVRFTRKK